MITKFLSVKELAALLDELEMEYSEEFDIAFTMDQMYKVPPDYQRSLFNFYHVMRGTYYKAKAMKGTAADTDFAALVRERLKGYEEA